MVGMWPIGVPLLYAVLLWTSRTALINRRPTRMSSAIGFLSDDYSADAFWWEPVEMCRKLALTGAMLSNPGAFGPLPLPEPELVALCF